MALPLLAAVVVATTILPGASSQVADEASVTHRKSVWGPVERNGKSLFPKYRELGIGIYQTELKWATIARSRPARAKDPGDAAYRWPSDVGYAVREARRNGMKVALMPTTAPRWANGGEGRMWAPKKASDYAAFVRAAARKYPSVRHWLIWGEPSRRERFRPLPRNKPKGPRIYARMLDRAYVALKRERRRNIVIGGNTFTTGHVSSRLFLKYMKLPGGRKPRMDMYGHNPFSARRPRLASGPLGYGFADFSDLDTLARWIDRYQGKRKGKRLPLYLSEFTIPTDHASHEFNFWVSRKTQASWLKDALEIVSGWRRIYTLGWAGIYDDQPNAPRGRHGDEVHRGLLDWRGRPKPAYKVFKNWPTSG